MLNKIEIMGRLTSDPELLYAGQKPVARFSLAVERDYASNGERQTDFVNCVIWNQGAEFVERHWHKGKLMLVVGRLQSRKWVGKNGSHHTDWEVNCENVYFCGDNNKSKFAEVEDDGEIPS